MNGTTPRTTERFQALVVVLAVLSLLFVAWPIATPLFYSAVLAGSLFSLFARLTRGLNGRKHLAALLLTMAAMLGVVAPFMALVTLGAYQATAVIEGAQAAVKDGRLAQAIERLPNFSQAGAWAMVDHFPSVTDIVSSGGPGMALTVTNLLTTAGHVLLMFALTFIGLFFLLLEGRSLVTWLDGVVPMPHGQFRSILGEFRKVSKSVMIAVGATAALQATTGLIGLLIARVSNPIFFTLLAFFLALIPAVGAAICFVVLGVVLILGGSTGAGLFLIAWGILAVGLVDNLLRPFFIGDGIEMHPGVVFFSLVGGLAAFGTAGLVAGPLTVAFFVAVMRVEARRRYAGLQPVSETERDAQPAEVG